MSFWDDYTVEDNIRAILRDVRYTPKPNHHFGRPFITAYQLAIEYDMRFPELRRQHRWPIGGRGSGEHQSLAQRLARELSGRIRNGSIQDIEGGFLSNCRLNDISFNSPSSPCGIIHSSATQSSYDTSMFRLCN